MVADRRTEIGAGTALGGTRARLLGLVLREAILLLALGLTIGLGFAAWAGRTAASLVYGMKPGDPLTLGAAVVLLAVAPPAARYAPPPPPPPLQPITPPPQHAPPKPL